MDPDDLTDLERRLAAHRPTADGLDADGMLFAAGREAGRRGRLVWPAVAGVLAVLAVGLGVWGAQERAGRLALVQRLETKPPAPVVEPPVAEEPSPSSWLASHRALEQGLDAWTTTTPGGEAKGADEEPPVLRLGQRNLFLGQ